MVRLLRVCVSCAALLSGGCARSQEAEVRAALAAKFPDGPRRCLGLAGGVVGIHLPATPSPSWFPSAGRTSPLRHAYLAYAAPAADPLPELVLELAAAGVLRRTTTELTIDNETSGPGPEIADPSGRRYRPIVFRHDVLVIPVALYATAPQSPSFDYRTDWDDSDPPWRPPSRLPSRRYGDPLPPSDVHYRVPVVIPYALSVATAACYPETVAGVSDVRTLQGWGGGERVEATVAFEQRPPAWMATAAFRRAAIGPSTEPIDRPRRVVIAFEPARDGTLRYLTEVRRP